MALAESHFVHQGAWIPATLVAALVILFFLGICVSRGRKADGRSDPLNFQPVAAQATKEELAIRDLRQRLSKDEERDQPPESLFFQLAWSRALDVDAAEIVWRRHLAMTRELRISEVSDELVRSAYRAGFCVRSGLDVDGRPMIWVRLAKSFPSSMTAAQVVKNTWLAQDATLASGAEANRQGICFVYDLTGVGLKNLTFDPMALRDVIRGALSHPSHISRVWLLDAPRIFLLSWHAFKHFVPEDVRKLVRFAKTRATGSPNDFSQVCPESELPVYLGGDPRRFAQPYTDWMFNELEGQALAYRTSKLRLPVPLRRNMGRHSGTTCYFGVQKLLRCFCLA